MRVSASVEGMVMGGLTFIATSSLFLIMCYGAGLVAKKKLTFGSLMSFAMYG